MCEARVEGGGGGIMELFLVPVRNGRIKLKKEGGREPGREG